MIISEERKVIVLDMITLAKERRKLAVGEGIITLSGATDFYDSESEIEEQEMGRDETLEDRRDAVSLYNEVYSSLSWTAQDVEAEMMVEKMPLDEYLSRGLELMTVPS